MMHNSQSQPKTLTLTRPIHPPIPIVSTSSSSVRERSHLHISVLARRSWCCCRSTTSIPHHHKAKQPSIHPPIPALTFHTLIQPSNQPTKQTNKKQITPTLPLPPLTALSRIPPQTQFKPYHIRCQELGSVPHGHSSLVVSDLGIRGAQKARYA